MPVLRAWGHWRIRQLIFGSTTTLLRSSDGPVLILRGSGPPGMALRQAPPG